MLLLFFYVLGFLRVDVSSSSCAGAIITFTTRMLLAGVISQFLKDATIVLRSIYLWQHAGFLRSWLWAQSLGSGPCEIDIIMSVVLKAICVGSQSHGGVQTTWELLRHHQAACCVTARCNHGWLCQRLSGLCLCSLCMHMWNSLCMHCAMRRMWWFCLAKFPAHQRSWHIVGVCACGHRNRRAATPWRRQSSQATRPSRMASEASGPAFTSWGNLIDPASHRSVCKSSCLTFQSGLSSATTRSSLIKRLSNLLKRVIFQKIEDKFSFAYNQSLLSSTQDSVESLAAPQEADLDDKQILALLASPLYLPEREAIPERSQSYRITCPLRGTVQNSSWVFVGCSSRNRLHPLVARSVRSLIEWLFDSLNFEFFQISWRRRCVSSKRFCRATLDGVRAFVDGPFSVSVFRLVSTFFVVQKVRVWSTIANFWITHPGIQVTYDCSVLVELCWWLPGFPPQLPDSRRKVLEFLDQFLDVILTCCILLFDCRKKVQVYREISSRLMLNSKSHAKC